MITKSIVGGITLSLVILVFAWAYTTMEIQLQASEFMSMSYAFQILANFDEGLFREGDANYVVVTINRGIIEPREIQVEIEVTVDDVVMYSSSETMNVITYKGGWLTGTIFKYLRGSEELITNSSVLLLVYTNMSDGARIFLRTRVRVSYLGVYECKDTQGNTFNVSMVNIFIPVLKVGESFGSNPYKLCLRTRDVEVLDRITIGSSEASPAEHTVVVSVDGYSLEITTDKCNILIVNIIHSEVHFEVRGA